MTTASESLPDLPPMVRESHLVAPSLPPSSRIPVRSEAEFRALYQRSLTDLGGYWQEVANTFEWMDGWPASVALGGDFSTGYRFFDGATMNVSVNCIDRHARTSPSKIALYWIGEDGSERSWTYEELLDTTARLAQALANLGVTKGDRVAIFLPNLLETFAAVHACFRIGAIYNIIFSGFSANALAERIVDTTAKVVITADESMRRGRPVALKATLDSVLDRLPSIEHVVVVRRTGAAVAMKAGRDHYFDELLAATPDRADPVAIEANEPAFIIYTSGTTAKPKGLVHTGTGFLVGTYHDVLWSLDLGPEDIYWCTADTGWLTFPIFELVGGLAHGATMVAYEGALDYPTPDRAYELIEKLKITKIFTAPTFLRMLARNGDALAKAHDLSSLKLIGLVGEPLDAKTWNWVHDNVGAPNMEINNTYGQSETGSAWTSSAVGITSSKPGSCGLALPGHAWEIVDESGEPVSVGKVGYLLITQPFPTMFRTIWNDPERYRAQYFTRFGADRYDTADAALVDGDGHIWVVGRVDGVINVAGHRLSTMEMESALLSVPGVAEAAVVGVDDETKGQVPVAFVSLSASASDVTVDALKAKITEEIGAIARPKQVYLLSTMPRTRSGKIVRRLLKELVVDGHTSGDTTGLEDPEVLAKLEAELG
ncbi:acetate--CoA ligase [Ferrimicrobium acidiphilum]|uniref:acetate--CoA ligase n=1 Tax=Ferrimicrobium acidiphilum TaxID=121039 RepID=UPI0023F40856|nr:acetate--CoA ligase [Ferrimicrobium acidiphilum]MCL5053418.1 acetate--CoA ligase [Gammaproteobacteria bacterium]